MNKGKIKKESHTYNDRLKCIDGDSQYLDWTILHKIFTLIFISFYLIFLKNAWQKILQTDSLGTFTVNNI